jgi:hypothetical protein
MKEDETPVKKEESKEIAVSEVKPAASDLNA